MIKFIYSLLWCCRQRKKIKFTSRGKFSSEIYALVKFRNFNLPWESSREIHIFINTIFIAPQSQNRHDGMLSSTRNFHFFVFVIDDTCL